MPWLTVPAAKALQCDRLLCRAWLFVKKLTTTPLKETRKSVPSRQKKCRAVDLFNRLLARMPKALGEAQSRAIDELNRGER